MLAAALDMAGLTTILLFSFLCSTRRFGDFALVVSFKDLYLLYIMQRHLESSEKKQHSKRK